MYIYNNHLQPISRLRALYKSIHRQLTSVQHINTVLTRYYVEYCVDKMEINNKKKQKNKLMNARTAISLSYKGSPTGNSSYCLRQLALIQTHLFINPLKE